MIRIATLSLALLVAAPAWACSVVPGYRVPTTLELAERADTVVIGTVTGAKPGADAWERSVLVRPSVLLKGAGLPRQVTLRGMIARPKDRVTRSDPNELRAPNPDALSGSCTRYQFRKGMKLVLFYARKDGKLLFLEYPFARVSEDIRSDDARWVKAVRVYIAVAALPEGKRRAALIALRDGLRAARDADSQAIAADIDRELSEKRAPLRD